METAVDATGICNDLSLCTADEKSLHQYGERIFNLQRAILLREGWRPLTDDVPGEFNFTQPVHYVFMNPEVIVPGQGKE